MGQRNESSSLGDLRLEASYVAHNEHSESQVWEYGRQFGHHPTKEKRGVTPSVTPRSSVPFTTPRGEKSRRVIALAVAGTSA